MGEPQETKHRRRLSQLLHRERTQATDVLLRVRERAWRISLALTLSRGVLAPVIVALTIRQAPGWMLVAVVVIAFLTDVFDGVIARRAGVVTPFLRRLDSATDTLFYLAVAWSVWMRCRLLVMPYRWAIAIVLLGEAISTCMALAKFRRDPSYHAWTARVWGLLLFLAVIQLFGAASATLLPLALLVGVVAEAEAIAITLTLPAWRTDVRSLRDARRVEG